MDKDAIIAALVSALRPFALAAEGVARWEGDYEALLVHPSDCEAEDGWTEVNYGKDRDTLTVGHLRAAADALRATGHDIEGGDA